MKVLGFEISRSRSGAEQPAPAVMRAEPPLSRDVAASAEVSGTQNPKAWLSEIGWGTPYPLRGRLPRVTPDRAELHGTVAACCNNIAGDLSKVPIKLWQRQPGGVDVRVEQHALPYLLNVAGAPGVPARIVRFAMVYAYALRGNGYAYAPRDGAGEIEMIELPKDGRAPQILSAGRARFYEFEDQGGVQRRVPSRSMAHLRYSALDGWTGRSPVSVAAESMGITLASEEAAGRTASGGTAKAVIKLADDYEDDEARARNARRVKDQITRPDADGFPVLGPDEDIKPLDLKASDMELLASRKFNREQIAGIYRMPPSKLQMLEYGVKANGEQQAIDYLTDCLLHWSVLVEAQLSLALLTESELRRGLFLRHDFGVLLQPTIKDQFEAVTKGVGGPVLTPNDGRARLGLPPVDDGDKLNPAPNMTRDEDQANTGGDEAEDDSEGEDE